MGYCFEDGLANSIITEVSSIKAWSGDGVLNNQISRSKTFTFTIIEINAVTLKQIYGEDNVTADQDAVNILHNSKLKTSQVWAFEILSGNERVKRILAPYGKTTSDNDVIYKYGEAIKYGVTISALPDSAGNITY